MTRAGHVRPTGGVGCLSGGSVGGGPERVGGSIRVRVTLALVGVAVLTLVTVGLLFYGFLGTYVVRQQEDVLLRNVEEVGRQVEALLEEAQLRPFDRQRGLNALLRIDLQVLPRGTVLALAAEGEVVAAAGPRNSLMALSPALLEEAGELAADGPGAGTVRGRGDARLIVAAAPVDLGDRRAFVVATVPVGDAAGDRAGLFRVLAIPGVVGVAFALVLGALLAGWLNRPLSRLSGAAATMASGSYAEPVGGSYPDEVYELAAGLEAMRREVRRSEESLRGFVAAAAHELRTPLTSIQGFSQALLDGTAATPEDQRRSAAAVFREASRLRRLVDALLTLSKYDSREFLPHVTVVDVARMLQEEIERLADAGLADPDRVTSVIEAPEEERVRTDPDMLRQVVSNLLRNAAQHGGDAPIAIRAEVGRHGLVLDVGSGSAPLSPDEAARVFTRFYRAPGARGEGLGLGLPLAREISEVLGGTVEVVADAPRAVFRVRIPHLDPVTTGRVAGGPSTESSVSAT